MNIAQSNQKIFVDLLNSFIWWTIHCWSYLTLFKTHFDIISYQNISKLFSYLITFNWLDREKYVMVSLKTISDRPKPIVVAVHGFIDKWQEGELCNNCERETLNNVNISEVFQPSNHNDMERALLQISNGRGCKKRLNDGEWNIILVSIININYNRRPLDLPCVRILASVFIRTLSQER